MSGEEGEGTGEVQPERLKVNELKTLLNERGLDTKGVKAVLVARLKAALKEEEADEEPAADGDSSGDMKIEAVESLEEQLQNHFAEQENQALAKEEEPLKTESVERQSEEKLTHLENHVEEREVTPTEETSLTIESVKSEPEVKDDEKEKVVETSAFTGSTEEEESSDEPKTEVLSVGMKASSQDGQVLTEKVEDTTAEFESKVSNEGKEGEEKLPPTSGGTDIMDDIISLTESLEKSDKIEDRKTDEAERDLSTVEPNRDLDEVVIADEVVIKNPDDVQSVEKLARELEKLKVIVLELTNYHPDFQPRTKEKLLLNLPFKDKKTLDDKDVVEFRTALSSLKFSKDLSNSGVKNLTELLASLTSATLVKDKLSKLKRNVSDLSDQLIDYEGHLKRKRARRENGRSEEKEEDEGETIGKAKAKIYRRKGNFPIIGVSEKDVSPIRENFDIKKVIGREKDDSGGRAKSKSKSLDTGPGDRSKPSQAFPAHVRSLSLVIDQLRKNMIIGLSRDPNFKLEKDWEFFTNMFKKQVKYTETWK